MKRNYKKAITGVLTIGVLGAGATMLPAEKIPAELQLKCDKADILLQKEFKDINNNAVIAYDYVSKRQVMNGGYKFEKGERFSNLKSKPQKNGASTTLEMWVGGDHYYKDDNGNIFEIEHGATTTKTEYVKQIKVSWIQNFFGQPAYALSTTTYCGAGDGYVYKKDTSGNNQAAWDGAHDATTGTSAKPTETETTWGAGLVQIHSTPFIMFSRSFWPSNTGAKLPVGANVSAASLFLRGHALADQLADYINVVQTDQPDHTTLTTADYNNCGATNNPTKGAVDFDLTGWSTSGYNELVLNSTGCGWISDTGWSMIGSRVGDDIDDIYPGSSNGMSAAACRFSEYAGTDSDPYLSITYTTGGAAAAAPQTTHINSQFIY